MKKLFTLALVALITLSASAQNNFQGRMERQSRQDRTEAINKQATNMAKTLKLKKENKDMFIALYLDWQAARFNAINPEGGDQEVTEATEAMNDYKNMTDEQAKELVAKNFERQEKQMQVDKDYYQKFLSMLTPVQAAQVLLEERGVTIPSSALGAGMMRNMMGGGGMPPMGGMGMGGGMMPMMGGMF